MVGLHKKIFTVMLILFISKSYSKGIKCHRSLILMGSKFDITVITEDKKSGTKYINMATNEIKRIEGIISSWNKNSQTSEINKFAGIKPVQISQELFDLIIRSKHISKVTDGAFDITYASIDKIWKFDGSMTKFPKEEDLKQSISRVGFEKIVMDSAKRTVFLPEIGMKIGFGAIGKGYAADKVRDLLENHGVVAGIINASGDLTTWGNQESNKPWMVGITNPLNKEKVFSWFAMNNNSVVTSGNYEKYVKFNNKLYSHIIDPRTGHPAKGVVSVSVFAPKAELADALATGIFVMGIEPGINLVNQLENIDCIFIDKNGNIHKSENIKFERVKR